MSDFEDDVKNTQEDMQKELDDLKVKYSSLVGQVEFLESSRMRVDQNISRINDSFEQINRNIQSIMDKLNVAEQPRNEAEYDFPQEEKPRFSLRKFIGHPLRRLAIGTVGLVLSATEKTSESATGFRKSIEDIVVEARHRNEERRMNPEGQI